MCHQLVDTQVTLLCAGVSEYIGYKSGRGGFPHGEKSILSMFNLIV